MAFYYMYPPDSAYTTYLPRSFPEHHFPLENVRHKLGDFVKSIHHDWEPGVQRPRVDVRETTDNFFIDIELPGLEKKENLKVKWTSTRTLLIEATIERPQIGEPVRPETSSGISPSGSHLETQSGAEKGEESSKREETKEAVHLTVKERHVGQIARAFDFPVDVDREALEAKLQSGLLRISVSKKDHEKVEHEPIEVEHT